MVWEKAIKEHLHSADIILLLVSASAIASDYFYDKEMKDALERHHAGSARVVPLILRPCTWQATPLGELQALPKDGKAVTSWPDRDGAYSNAVTSLWEMIKNHNAKQRESAAQLAEGQRREKEAKQREEELQRQKEAEAKRKEQQAIRAEHQRKSAKEKEQAARVAKQKGEAIRAEKRKAQRSKISATLSHPALWGGIVLLVIAFVVFKACGGTGDSIDDDIDSDTKDTIATLIEDVNNPEVEYQALIKKAQKDFDAKNYEAAKTQFEAAQLFAQTNKLDLEKAKKGITACKNELKKIASQQSQKEKKANYKKWKDKGDAAYKKKNYTSAKDYYETAANYDNSREIKKLIKKCEDEIEAKKKADQRARAAAAEAERKKKAQKPPVTTTPKLPYAISQLEKNMKTIPAGSFTMGCTSEQGSDCDDDEKHTRKVSVSRFKMGKYEVTQAEWKAVMGQDPPELKFKGCDQCPVERVSWNDIQDFLKKLNQKTGKRYRLPSEAEWEYAARGGETYKYAGSNTIGNVAWYDDNSGSKTHPVGGKNANGYGLYDMSGNVYEWCQDKWHGSYNGGPTNGGAWESGSSSSRVYRGGGWYGSAQGCRVSNRSYVSPGNRHSNIGFRLALSY